MSGELRVIPLQGIPEVEAGDDLGALVAEAAERSGGLEDADIVVVAQKAVSKAEGRVVRLDEVEPSARALELADDRDARHVEWILRESLRVVRVRPPLIIAETRHGYVCASARALELADDRDARHVEWILRESARVVRVRPPLIIAETRHGFVCASAGVDASNAKGEGTLVLLPLDPDASAARLRDALRERTGCDVGVIVSDSFGRPFRQGTVDVALGVAGLTALRDLRGVRDAAGYELHATQIAIADEIAAAAELVLGKVDGIPAAVVRGLDVRGDGRGADILIPEERDLFR